MNKQLGALCVAAIVVVSGCGRGSDEGGGAAVLSEPSAGTWATWVLRSPDQIEVPPPGADSKSEQAEVERLAATRDQGHLERVHRWNDYPANGPWVTLSTDLVSQHPRTPPHAARAYALVSVAVYDAVIAANHWKDVYDRKGPRDAEPVVAPEGRSSYPSDHAAMAGAASRVLAYLFPERAASSFDELAEEAADSRVVAGTNFPSDVAAGLALGRSVADAVIARAKVDGSQTNWTTNPPRRPGVWAPPPGMAPEKARALEPLARTWRTWAVRPDHVRPGPPPAVDSPELRAQAQEVVEVTRSLTEEQKRITTFWAGGPGTPAPPGIWNRLALEHVGTERLSLPRLARTFALLNIAQADAAVAVWDCKYEYWSARPVNVIRDTGMDRSFTPFLPTPVFPGYVSGHAGFSAAASEVLAHLFPGRAAHFRSQAEEAAMSRLYGGIHFRVDNEVGLDVGRRVAQGVMAKAGNDGSSPAAKRAA